VSVASPVAVQTTRLPSGETVAALGQGTWYLGESPQRRRHEIAALRLGLDLGMTLIDTAEMYGNGAAEKLVGEAIAGRRQEVFLVSKVLPQHATARGTIAACEGSLRRLNTDVIDLYLLHWRGRVPLWETLDAFVTLIEAGKIRYWGVSNFDVIDMEELRMLPGGDEVATDQVLYNLTRRGIEADLLPMCQQRHVPIMAYSPIEQGRLLDHPGLLRVAARHHATPAQVALAWVLRVECAIAIPRTGTPEHVRDNCAALDVRFSKEDLAELDRAFPLPNGKVPLEML
jgi:diketogulonate reductase-like aldo/keto reductase